MDIEDITREFAKEFKSAIRPLSSFPSLDVEVIPTGSLAIDAALGRGGWPRRHFVEIYGPEGAGKTTLVIMAIAQTQRMGGRAMMMDAEHRFDYNYAKALGVDPDKLIFTQPTSAEEGFNILSKALSRPYFDFIAVDSIDALRAQSEIDGDMDDSNVATHPRVIGRGMRRLSQLRNSSNTAVVFTNQIREKVGVMFGSPEYQPGGRAPKFYCSIRARVSRKETINEEKESVANLCRIEVKKNSIAPPFREAMFTIHFGQGIKRAEAIFQYASESGIFERRGSGYYISGTLACKGKQGWQEWDNETCDIIERQIKKSDKWKTDVGALIQKSVVGNPLSQESESLEEED